METTKPIAEVQGSDQELTSVKAQSVATMSKGRVIKRLVDQFAEAQASGKDALARKIKGDIDFVLYPPKRNEKKELSPEQREILLHTLQTRFEKNLRRHPTVWWTTVEKALKADPEKFWSLYQMAYTGGEPDVIMENKTELIFGDCSPESPAGRRNVVYDAAAEAWVRTCHPQEKFNGNAADRVAEWGAEFMDEGQFRMLQAMTLTRFGNWDWWNAPRQVNRETQDWLQTPADIRKANIALTGYRVLGSVSMFNFSVDHHSEDKGFRCILRVPKIKEG